MGTRLKVKLGPAINGGFGRISPCLLCFRATWGGLCDCAKGKKKKKKKLHVITIEGQAGGKWGSKSAEREQQGEEALQGERMLSVWDKDTGGGRGTFAARVCVCILFKHKHLLSGGTPDAFQVFAWESVQRGATALTSQRQAVTKINTGGAIEYY